MSEVSDVSKAVQATGQGVAATAKLGSDVVAAGSGLAGYLARTVGNIPEDLIGIAGGDWLHEARQRNLQRLRAKTAKLLASAGVEPVSEPSPSVVVPLITAAADENREELQDLWAALLAAACDPAKVSRVRRAFFETLKALEPLDAVLLRAMAEAARAAGPQGASQHASREMAMARGLSELDVGVSRKALVDLGCLWAKADLALTAYGRAFVAACGDD